MYLRLGTACVILVVMSERDRTRDAERAVKSTAWANRSGLWVYYRTRLVIWFPVEHAHLGRC